MDSKGALEGIKIADFGWVAADPQISRELAFHGATVVRVECHRSVDTLRTCPPFKDFQPRLNSSAFFAMYNSNKYGISLDLNKARGVEVAGKLVSWADVMTEGMVPGIMAKWGLGYEDCRKIKPDIIYCSTSTFGQFGPLKKAMGYGMYAAGYAGFSHILGWPDRHPLYTYNYLTDFFAPQYTLVAVIGALIRRRETGEGIYIDQSQVESGINALGTAMLDYKVNKRIASRLGNRDPYLAPHGVYPCRGNDRWLAIAATTEQEWISLAKVINEPWCQDAKFSTLPLRKKNEDELDTLIAAWTLNYTAEQAMQMLLDVGIPAGVVEAGQDLFSDPQLKSRGHFKFLEHKDIGRHAYHSPSYRLSKTPHRVWKAAPCLGEDNEYVYKEILGLTDEEIGDLLVEGVITTDADVGVMRAAR